MPVRVTPTRAGPWLTMALTLTEAATAPGSHDSREATTASDVLMPARRLTLGAFDTPTAA